MTETIDNLRAALAVAEAETGEWGPARATIIRDKLLAAIAAEGQNGAARQPPAARGGNGVHTPTLAAKDRPRIWRSPSERARSLGGQGQRIATGISTFDRATRGGPRAGAVVVAGGAPGAGKTTLSVQLGHAWARAGFAVAILAADEDADGLLIRVGQAIGLDRDALEEGNEAARIALADHLGGLSTFMLVDADEDNALIDDASAELVKRRPPGVPSVLIVDSLQTVRSSLSIAADNPRARIDGNMLALKRAAKVDGHLVIVTSELARGAYRSKDASDRIDDLAAFKESGGVEYGAGIAMVLRSVPGGGGLVDVAIAKNRLGEKLAFRLSLDYDRATFAEVDLPDSEQADPAEAKRAALCAKALDLVERTPNPYCSKNALARALGVSKSTALAAINELLDLEVLVFAAGRFRVIRPSGSGGSEPVPEPPIDRGGSSGSMPIGQNREPEPVLGTDREPGEEG